MNEASTYLTLTSGATFGPLRVLFELDQGGGGAPDDFTVHRIEICGVPISNGLEKAITEDGIAWTAINDLVQDHIDDCDLANQEDQARSQCERKPGEPF